jgi:hypothetical protein
LLIYTKNEQDDLTADQRRLLGKVIQNWSQRDD